MSLEKDEKSQTSHEPPLILGVSGGVDSVAMLHILARHTPKQRLVVAHVDHGIRPTSDWDERFVGGLAEGYGLKYHATRLKLGEKASEAQAREARYDYLFRLMRKLKAQAVVVAHHQDDIVETMIMNILRGTGRRGLISLRSRGELIRPLLHMTKEEIYRYALKHKLEWLEDETNLSRAYQRNRVRLELVPAMLRKDPDSPAKLLKIYRRTSQLDAQINELLPAVSAIVASGKRSITIKRPEFRNLPDIVARELVYFWIRESGAPLSDIGGDHIKSAVKFIHESKPAKTYSPTKGLNFRSTKNEITLRFASRDSNS